MSETSKDYLSKYSGEQVEARLGRCNLVPTLDHVPGAEGLSFVDAEGTHTFLVGDECRYLDTEKEAYRFYKLNDITSDGKAEWFLVRGVEAGDELSKDAIEQALTGNITTHRHDTTYQETTFETDVWDGSSISSSLQGSGTKDDPYLIQSCADWLHLRANGGEYNINSTDGDIENISFAPYFKINKNLDFGNKAIPELNADGSIGQLVMCVFDGNRAKFSNFVDSQGTGILPNSAYYFAHDFVIENFQRTADVSSLIESNIPIFSEMDLYSSILNCTVNANVTLTGSVSELTEPQIIVTGEYNLFKGSNFATYINNYVESNGCFEGIDINITDNTTKSNDAKIVAVFLASLIAHPISLYCAVPLDYVNVFADELPQEDFSIAMVITGVQPACLYTNSDGVNTINFQDMESGEFSTFTGTPKSLTEMQSESFVEELNSLLPKPAFKKDPEGGTPILAQYGEIAYDGYVKQSEFESFKAKLSVETPAEGSPFVDITLTTSQFPTDGDVIELNTEQYNTIKSGLLNGKILRVKAVCGIFFGSTTTLITTDYGSGEVNPENSIPAVLIWVTNPSEGIEGGAPISAVQFTVYFSKDTNESGNYEATFYGMKGNFVLSEEIDTIKKLTQSEYDGLSSKDSETLYVIVG